jgi:gas vesicle protein
MKTSRIILSTIIASAVGVAVGMLFAPQKGSKTRQKISKKNHEYSDYVSDKVEEFVDSISHPLENIEDETERLALKANKKAKIVASKLKTELN